jgi:hypothetical protein
MNRFAMLNKTKESELIIALKTRVAELEKEILILKNEKRELEVARIINRASTNRATYEYKQSDAMSSRDDMSNPFSNFNGGQNEDGR